MIRKLLPLLILTPILLSANDRIMRWDPVPHASGYIVEIEDSTGSRVVRHETAKTEYPISLPRGAYRYRITVLNKLGQPEASTDWTRFEIRSMQKPQTPHSSFSTRTSHVVIEETEEEEEEEILERKYTVSLSPTFLFPAGKLRKLFSPGAGVTLSAGINNFPEPRFEAALFTSIYHIPGKSDYYVDHSLFMPFGLSLGYHRTITHNSSLFPFMRIGGLYSYTYYTEPERFDSSVVMDPLGSLGIAYMHKIRSIQLMGGGSASLLYEDEGVLGFFELFAGIRITF